VAEQRQKARSKRRRRKIDFAHARLLYERDGKTFTQIGELLGIRRETVSRRAHREKWKRRDIARDALANVTEQVADRVVREIGTEIVDTIKEAERQRALALRVNGQLLAGLAAMVEPQEDGTAPTLLFGLGSSPDLTLRRCFLNLGAVVGRPDGSDEPSGGGSDADSEAESAALRGLLDEAEGDEPAGH
jgi:hypothetical protein